MKSFVVRLFVPVHDGSAPEGALLRGVVQEVASGRDARFASGEELIAFLAAVVGGRQSLARPTEREAS